MIPSPHKLPFATLVAYAAPATIISVLNMALIIYIPPFYATEIGLNLALIGLAFFAARAWDVLLDPIIGTLSDRTASRWGRRNPWIALGAPVLVGATWALFAPPEGANAWYLMAAIFTFYLSWTMVQIPYLSWGAELTTDYRERNRVVGFREGATFVGILLATSLPIAIYTGAEPTIAQILKIFVWLTVALFPVTVIWALRMVPRGIAASQGQPATLKVSMAVLRQNKPFLILIATTFLTWLGLNIYNATVLLIIEFSVGLPKGDFLILVLIQFLVGMMLTPLIVRAANRLGKHRTLAISVGLTTLALPLLMAIPEGNRPAAMAVFALLGVAISPIWILPTALIADAADYAALKGGANDVGLYMAIYNFFLKLAIALSVGIALPLVNFFGFNPAHPTAPGVRALDLVGLVLPGLIFIPAAIGLWLYPINETRHTIIKRRLAAREVRGLAQALPPQT